MFYCAIYYKQKKEGKYMANRIALIWDFDKTLVDGYMQNPIFEDYGVDANTFWKEVNSLPEKYRKEQGIEVNKDTIYLNLFIQYAKQGIFKGLNNDKLFSYGKKLKFYPGVIELIQTVKRMVESDPSLQEYDIKVENYIVSTGMKRIIEGSPIHELVEGIWGCELIEEDGIISQLGYTIDNTSKTRAIFEINKGIPQNPQWDVNAMVPEELRRVPFENMIYIADGPSDIPAFSVVKKNKGSTFAIYPKGNMEAFKQVEQMRQDGRIDMYAEADYSKDTTAYMWITNKVLQIANRIRKKEKEKLNRSISQGPRHIN